MPRYAELHCHSEFSFLDGASPADDLVERAMQLGLGALAVTDHQGLYGVVRFVTAAETAGIHPVVGVEIELLDAAVPDPGGIVVPARRRGRTQGSAVPVWEPWEPDPAGGLVESGRPVWPRADRTRLPGHRDPVREDLRGVGDGQRGPHLVLLARDQVGYRSLSRLISSANLAATKGVPRFTHALLERHTEGVVALSGCRHGEIARRLLAGDREGAARAAERYARMFGAGTGGSGGSGGRLGTGDGRPGDGSHGAPGGFGVRPSRHGAPGIGGFVLELQHHLLPDDDWLVAETVRLAAELGLPVAVTNDVHYALPEDRELQDVMVAIRHGLTLDESAHLRRPNGEYRLKPAGDLLALPPGDAGADPGIRRAWAEGMVTAAELADACRVDLGFERYRFPGFEVPKDETPFSHLEALCHEGARRRYHPLTPRVVSQLAHELDVIERTGLAEFFLICWDLTQFARKRGIPAQGRGSAGDSIVAYVLGITRVDPIRHNLLFERFINEGRTSYPDVDIDFASSRREEVIQYVYDRYGPEHTGMVCNVITYRARSAVREVGYALGFPRPLVDRVAKALETYDSVMVRRDLEAEGGFAEFFAPPGPYAPPGSCAPSPPADPRPQAAGSAAGSAGRAAESAVRAPGERYPEIAPSLRVMPAPRPDPGPSLPHAGSLAGGPTVGRGGPGSGSTQQTVPPVTVTQDPGSPDSIAVSRCRTRKNRAGPVPEVQTGPLEVSPAISPAVAQLLASATGFVDEMGQLNHARGGHWRRGTSDDEGGPGDTPVSIAWLRAERGRTPARALETPERTPGPRIEALQAPVPGVDPPRTVAGPADPWEPGTVGGHRIDPESGVLLPVERRIDRSGVQVDRFEAWMGRPELQVPPVSPTAMPPDVPGAHGAAGGGSQVARIPDGMSWPRSRAGVVPGTGFPSVEKGGSGAADPAADPAPWAVAASTGAPVPSGIALEDIGDDTGAGSAAGAAWTAARRDTGAESTGAGLAGSSGPGTRAPRPAPHSSVARLEPEPPPERRAGSTAGLSPWERWLELCARIDGRPRHLGIHVGGMLVTAVPLVEIAPLERATMPGRVVVQFDKRDVETMKLIKLDLLGLRMLSAMDDALRDITADCGVVLDLDRLPEDLPDVFRMIRAADTTGVFQIESRAQMQTLPKSAPTTLDDLVVEVAIIRPGPIQGNAVHPYLRRRQGLEPVSYLHPALEPILRETLGVILYQEQVMGIAIRVAGFSAAESDGFRRAMGTWRSSREMEKLHQRFVDGCRTVSGLDEERAEELFRQVAAFASFGFNKSHAAAFARTAYESAFLKLCYPAQFTAGLINNQPMGFYPVEVLINDAKRHGVAVLPVDVDRSRYRTTTEWVGLPGEPLPEGSGIDRRPPVVRSSGCVVPDARTRRQLAAESAQGYGVRLGLHLVKGIGQEHADALDGELEHGPYRSLADVVARTGLAEEVVERLIRVGALDSLGRPRRELLWQLREVAASTGRTTTGRACPPAGGAARAPGGSAEGPAGGSAGLSAPPARRDPPVAPLQGRASGPGPAGEEPGAATHRSPLAPAARPVSRRPGEQDGNGGLPADPALPAVPLLGLATPADPAEFASPAHYVDPPVAFRRVLALETGPLDVLPHEPGVLETRVGSRRSPSGPSVDHTVLPVQVPQDPRPHSGTTVAPCKNRSIRMSHGSRMGHGGRTDGSLPGDGPRPGHPATSRPEYEPRPVHPAGNALAARAPAREHAEPLDLRLPPTDAPDLPQPTELERLADSYAILSLDACRQVVELFRPALDRLGVVPTARLADLRPGRVRIAGLVVTRQHPMTARGTVFLALEDETGMANVTLWPDRWAQFRGVVRRHALLWVDGELQREASVVNVVAREVRALPDVARAAGGPGAPGGIRAQGYSGLRRG